MASEELTFSAEESAGGLGTAGGSSAARSRKNRAEVGHKGGAPVAWVLVKPWALI